ncbi:MAG: metal-dependent hydrolase [Opitutus sp.]|nr:metal-dependent hydrolase [Opitutus sp.]
MDPVTHILLGANIAYAAFGRRLGRAAAALGGLAAFAPDADIFIHSAMDPLVAIEHHRGFTHALAMAPVGAAIVATLWLARAEWRSWVRWRGLFACALAGYASHALLDAATTYGTQLWWPFSRHRAGWDLISIIDPIFTFALGAGLAVSLTRQRVRAAWVALAAGAGYLTLGGVQQARAVAAQRILAAARGHTIERSEVMPTMANQLVWRALYEHRGQIFSDRIRVGWFAEATVREGWALPLVRAGDLTPAERERDRRESFVRFAWFSNAWVARSPGDESLLADMRYSLSAEAFDPIWGIRFTAPGAPTEVEWINRTKERKITPGEFWREISGADERFREVGAAGKR